MIVGFTGTPMGPLQAQTATMRRVLRQLPIERFIHCASGHADTIAHNIVRACHGDIRIEAHPDRINHHISSIVYAPIGNLRIAPERPPAERNARIVQRMHGLIAVPQNDFNDGSNTWLIVEEARKIGLPVYLITCKGAFISDPWFDI